MASSKPVREIRGLAFTPRIGAIVMADRVVALHLLARSASRRAA